MPGDIIQLFIEPLIEAWDSIINYLPNILAALLFMLIGLFIARAIRTVSERILKKIKIDEHTSKVGINEILARLGLGKSPSYVIVFIIYWSTLLVFMISAANALNLTAVSILLGWLLEFLPKLIAAVIVAFGGLLFARFISEIVLNSATANNIKGGMVISRIVHAIVIIFTGVIAFEQLGIAISIVRSSLNIILGSLGLAFAIAAGLGAKDIASEMLREIFARKEIK